MMSFFHPAFSIPFSDLIEGLEMECDRGNVNKRTFGPLTQYTYTQYCTYSAQWNLFTTVARGIIVDDERIVALPFPKFFNLTENKTVIPDLPFKCYEKVDGSLIIVFYYNGHWMTATKGSFNSDQSNWAKKFMILEDIQLLDKDVTYLFEAVYPENKIVVNYQGVSELVALGGYNNMTGEEIPVHYLGWVAPYNNVRQVKTYNFSDLATVECFVETMSSNEEGFILRYDDGTRVKIKGAEYCRLHRMISNITPLAIWEMMWNQDDLEFVRKELPEEFLIDFDNIVHLLEMKIDATYGKVVLYYKDTINLSDKELGLMLHSFDDDVKTLIFPYRKTLGKLLSNPKSRQTLFRMHRPTANKLEGYMPSSSINRVQDDE